ncbi:MAG TPA: hypothetical protein VFG47_00870, partial [Geminicoccaceae bacterium]|nr:hypothetical protein [Geminicoccaceae bacterium]
TGLVHARSAGSWSATGQSLRGPEGEQGPEGPAGQDGADGSVWHDGTAAPAQGLGADGDYYLNSATGDVYAKVAGSWSQAGNIRGPQGQAGADGQDGVDGQDGADGARWHDGTGAPASGLGADGDYYLDDATGDVYAKSGGSWSPAANIQGPAGGPLVLDDLADVDAANPGTDQVLKWDGAKWVPGQALATIATESVEHTPRWTGARTLSVKERLDGDAISLLDFENVTLSTGNPDASAQPSGPAMDNNLLALQKLRDACAAEKRRGYIPATVWVRNALNIERNDVHIVGPGRFSGGIMQADKTKSVVAFTKSSVLENAALTDMTLGYGGFRDNWGGGSEGSPGDVTALRLNDQWRCSFERLVLYNVQHGIGHTVAQVQDGNFGSPSWRPWFECAFRDIYIKPYTGYAILKKTGTGCTFDTLYLSIGGASGGMDGGDFFRVQGGIWFNATDGDVFNKLNLEWLDSGDHLVRLTDGKDVVINSLHVEGLRPRSTDQGLFDLNFRSNLVVNALHLQNMAARASLGASRWNVVRMTGGDNHAIIDGIYAREFNRDGTVTVGLVRVADGSTGNQVYVRGFSPDDKSASEAPRFDVVVDGDQSGVSALRQLNEIGLDTPVASLGDVGATVYIGEHGTRLRCAATLTANRTWTLSNRLRGPLAGSVNAPLLPSGAAITIARTGGGAFDLNVANHNGSVFVALRQNESVEVAFDGTNWALMARRANAAAALPPGGAAGQVLTKNGAADYDTGWANAGGSGEANTASNLGGGTGIFAQKSDIDLRFKSLVAGANMAIASDANTITLTSTGPAGGSGSIPTLKDTYGAAGNNSTNDAAALGAVPAGIGVVLTPATYLVSSSVTVNGVLHFMGGAKLRVSSGAIITWGPNSGIVAGDYQIFDCAVPAVPGPIVFSLSPGDGYRPLGMTNLKQAVNAAWFPGESNDPTGGGTKRDMGKMINTAIHAGCRDILIPGGRTWNLFTTVRIVGDLRIRGGRGNTDGESNLVLKTSGKPAFEAVALNLRWTLEGLDCWGNETATPSFGVFASRRHLDDLSQCGDCNLIDCNFEGHYGCFIFTSVAAEVFTLTGCEMNNRSKGDYNDTGQPSGTIGIFNFLGGTEDPGWEAVYDPANAAYRRNQASTSAFVISGGDFRFGTTGRTAPKGVVYVSGAVEDLAIQAAYLVSAGPKIRAEGRQRSATDPAGANGWVWPRTIRLGPGGRTEGSSSDAAIVVDGKGAGVRLQGLVIHGWSFFSDGGATHPVIKTVNGGGIFGLNYQGNMISGHGNKLIEILNGLLEDSYIDALFTIGGNLTINVTGSSVARNRIALKGTYTGTTGTGSQVTTNGWI